MNTKSFHEAYASVGEIPVASNGERPPWCLHKGYRGISTKDVISKEIIDFADWISLTPQEKNIRNIITQQIKSVAKINFPDIRIDCTGSTATKTCLPLSDIDYAASNIPKNYGSEFLHNFLNCLLDFNVIQNDAKIIPAAVPIIKARSKNYSLSLDISSDQSTIPTESPTTNALLNIARNKKYMETYPVLYPVLLLIKYYIFEQCQLNEPFTGGFSSTMIFTMLIFAIEVCPEPIRDSPADVLIAFMNIYGGLLNPIENIIDVHDGGRLIKGYAIPKVHYKMYDPQDRGHLIEQRADKHVAFMKACAAASSALRKPHRPGESVLMRFLDLAKIKKYERDREDIMNVYRKMFGPSPPRQSLLPKERAERWSALAEFTSAAVEHSRVRRMGAARKKNEKSSENEGQWITEMWNRSHFKK